MIEADDLVTVFDKKFTNSADTKLEVELKNHYTVKDKENCEFKKGTLKDASCAGNLNS